MPCTPPRDEFGVAGTNTSWAMYVAVFLVLIGLVVLLAYYLLPQDALHRSFWSVLSKLCNCMTGMSDSALSRDDWTVEHGSQTYSPDVAPPSKPIRQSPAMSAAFSAGQAWRQDGEGRYEMAAAAAAAPTRAGSDTRAGTEAPRRVGTDTILA